MEMQVCDDALVEIFVRLPSKSVLRCRAVCKRWHRVTSDPSFLTAHAAHRPREMIVITRYRTTLRSVPLSLTPRPPDDMGRRGYLCDMGECTLLASLHGLLLLQERQGLYIICNPTTRQWTYLPSMQAVSTRAFPCGFYHHSSSGEYRLLCHGVVVGEEEADYYYVLSAGAFWPRRLLTTQKRAPAIRPVGDRVYQSPVAHRGTLYWLLFHPEAGETGKMLAYDTASEAFRLVARPPSCSNKQAALVELARGALRRGPAWRHHEVAPSLGVALHL
ncbi:hypothetical protein QOZ80_5BG0409810 [Eleusine coracana subsp. coracana]|nr:hypothetical protein QOZ80_5BG0409810 [Eleusine coracana subsp. coracana]